MKPLYCFIIIIIIIIITKLISNYNNKDPTLNLPETYTNRPSRPTREIIYLKKSRAKQFFLNDKSAISYLASVHPKTVTYKINNLGDLSNYYQAINNFTKSEKHIFKKMVTSLPKTRLLQGIWQFAKTSPQLEFGMPFTLGDIILLPSVSMTNNFRRTLVHERIHVLERQFTKEFNRFLIERLGFRLVKRRGKIPFTIFSNPDGLQLDNASWIFYHFLDKEWYCPFLTINDHGNLSKKAVSVKFISDNIVTITYKVKNVEELLSQKFPTCPPHHLYHPYEIMAELGMMFIMDGTSGNTDVDNFYNKFLL